MPVKKVNNKELVKYLRRKKSIKLKVLYKWMCNKFDIQYTHCSWVIRNLISNGIIERIDKRKSIKIIQYT